MDNWRDERRWGQSQGLKNTWLEYKVGYRGRWYHFHFTVGKMRHVASHVFPWPSSLFHEHRHPRVPRPSTKILGHQSESRLSCRAGYVDVCSVAGAWPVQFAFLVLVVETPRQNNALVLSSEDFKALCRHQTHPTSPLRSWWAGLLKRIISAKQRQAFAFSHGKGWLELQPMASWALQDFLVGKSFLVSLYCLSEIETGSCPCFLTILKKLNPLGAWTSHCMGSQCLGET